ncbi:MAG: hypothetical protein ACK5PP_14975 [Acidimicrobiales bacterium]
MPTPIHIHKDFNERLKALPLELQWHLLSAMFGIRDIAATHWADLPAFNDDPHARVVDIYLLTPSGPRRLSVLLHVIEGEERAELVATDFIVELD